MIRSFRMVSWFFILGLTLLGGSYAVADSNPPEIIISSRESVLHLGSIDSFDITKGGIQAARQLLLALETGNLEHAEAARRAYQHLIPNENFGGEYSALAWFCDYLLGSALTRSQMVADPFHKSFCDFFADDNFNNLKEYLGRKYHLKEFEDADTMPGHRWLGFLEDFILFNNPRREEWEKTRKILETLQIRPGEAIADIGSGPGYYTFKFAQQVGSAGKVYAIDINLLHNAYNRDFAKLHGVQNVEVVNSELDNIGLQDNSVDLAFSCSLYHIIYTTFSEPSRERFLASIRSALKDSGRLVLVDNGPVPDKTLPYHGPYINRELIISQLQYYGFRLEAAHQFIPQRYVLVFRKVAQPKENIAPVEKEGQTSPLRRNVDAAAKVSFQVPIADKRSLVYIPNDTLPDITEAGREAALWFYRALETGSREAAEKARAAYQVLIPKEKFGDEYTAFEWFCEYLLAPAGQQQEMVRNPLIGSYFHHLSANEFEVLKNYLWSRYRFTRKDDRSVELETGENKEEIEGQKIGSSALQGGSDLKITAALRVAFLNRDRIASLDKPKYSLEEMVFWRDFILFNNPRRSSWEHSNRITELVKLRPGQAIADIGAGPGYFSFKFSELVGPAGTVYAVDTNKKHLDYIEKLILDTGTRNIRPILSELDNAKLPERSIDAAFLCSLYGVVYAASMEHVKDSFISSIRSALKPGGRLIIVDNSIVKPPVLPYHGPHIDPRLVIAQLSYYGFRLIEEVQVIPQRYALIFEVSSKAN